VYNPQVPIHGAATLPGATSGNTSGMGRASAVPPELMGWNWGAFFLNLFWGIGNNPWIALLMLVPAVNWVMPFVLGVKGSAWAWQNKRWQDIAHFRRVQRRWAIAGFILFLVWLAGVAAAVALPVWLPHAMLARNPVQELAFTAVRMSPEATALLGTPIEHVSGSRGTFASAEQEGVAQVRFVVTGPNGSATVEAQGRNARGGWQLERVVVLPSGGGPALVVLPRQRL